MKRILLLSVVALLVSAEGFAQKTIVEYRDAQARIGDGIAEVHVKPTITEVKLVSTTRINDTWPLTAKDVAGLGGKVADIRAWAAYLSSVKNNCDIIMNPIFKIEGDDAGGAKVTVVGYPGDFVNWHSATKEDFEWLVQEDSWSKNIREITAPVTGK